MPIKDTIYADVIIVGAGAAGLAAAVAAAENNVSKIVIVEKRSAVGGNAAFVMGMFAAQSGIQTRMGIDADADELFRIAMSYAHWQTNPRLVRRLINGSAQTLSWLEKHGLEIDRIHPMYPNQTPMVFHFHKAPGRMGAAYVKAYSEKCRAMGVTTLVRTPAEKLMISADSGIEGVLVQNENKKLRISAKVVVLATGGYLGNEELIQSYLPTYDHGDFHFAGIPQNGDGIRLASAVGAALDGMAVLEMNGPVFPTSNYLSIVLRNPKTIWLNQQGRRFTDESLTLFPETANCIFRQPGKYCYALFDESIKNQMLKGPLQPLDAMLIDAENWEAKAHQDLEKFSERSQICISSSLADIAAYMGTPTDRIEKTINIYNSMCNKGFDDAFAKGRKHLQPITTAPYYAIRAGIKLMTTHGGVKINEHMEVVDSRDIPIPGLFAAGVETGSTDAGSYDAHLTGHSFGFSVTSGRIAGENAAVFLKEGRS